MLKVEIDLKITLTITMLHLVFFTKSKSNKLDCLKKRKNLVGNFAISRQKFDGIPSSL